MVHDFLNIKLVPVSGQGIQQCCEYMKFFHNHYIISAIYRIFSRSENRAICFFRYNFFLQETGKGDKVNDKV